MVRTRATRLLAAGFAISIIAAGCGSGDDPTLETSSEGADQERDGNGDDAASFNDADVTFAQSMIVHHEQAIEMAALAADRADSDEVRDLAERIEAAQQPEIELMETWLDQWGQERPADSGMDGMGMDHGASGMMSEDEMAALEGASGEDFDRMFLELMIVHHQGAIEMARAELEDGTNPDALDVARAIVETQSDEVAEMEALLTAL